MNDYSEDEMNEEFYGESFEDSDAEITTDPSLYESNIKNTFDELKLLRLILDESKAALTKQRRRLFMEINNLDFKPDLIIKLVHSIILRPNDSYKLDKSQYFIFLIFIKNFFETIYKSLIGQFDRKKSEKIKYKESEQININHNEINHNEINYNEINHNDNNEIMNKFTFLFNSSALLVDLVFNMIRLILDPSYENRHKEIIKIIINFLSAIIFKLKLNINVFYDIMQILNKELTSDLKYEKVISLLNVYESLFLVREDNFYDEENFSQSLEIPQFILNNFDKIENINVTSCNNDSIEENNNSTDSNKKLKLLNKITFLLKTLTKKNIKVMESLMKQNDLIDGSSMDCKLFLNKLFFNNENFLKIFHILLYSKVKFDDVDFTNLNLVNLNNFDSEINFFAETSFKTNLIISLNDIIKFLVKHKLTMPQQFYQFIFNTLKDFIHSFCELNKVYSLSNLKEISIKEIQINEYFSSMLIFMRLMISYKEAEIFLIHYKSEVLESLLFPLIKISLSEKETFLTDPLEFIKLVQDFTFENKIENVKSKALAFLKKLAASSQSFLEYLCIEILNLFKAAINQSNNELNQQNNLKFYTTDECLDLVFSILACLMKKIYLVKNLFFLVDQNISHFIKNHKIEDEEILSKFLILIFTLTKSKLKLFLLNKEIPLDFNCDENLHLYIVFLIKSISLNVFLKKNFTFNILSISNLSELLFHKTFLTFPQIKDMFTSHLKNHFIEVTKILSASEDLTVSDIVNDFLIKLTKEYGQSHQLQEEMANLYHHFLSGLHKELERFYKFKYNSKPTKNIVTDFHSSYKFFNYITTIQLFINNELSVNDKFNSTYVQSFIDKIIINVKFWFNWNFDEEIVKILMLIFSKSEWKLSKEKITILTNDLFNEIQNQNYKLKFSHLNLLVANLKLVIHNQVDIEHFKSKTINLLQQGLNTKNDYLRSYTVLASYLTVFVNHYSDFGLTNIDYKDLTLIISNRLQNKKNKLNTSGPCLNSMLLAFHFITIINLPNLEDFIHSVSYKVYEFMIKKTISLLEDHTNLIENTISQTFMLTMLKIAIKEYEFDTQNKNKNREDFVLSIIEFMIKSLTFNTFNYSKAGNKESIENYFPTKVKNIPSSNKKPASQIDPSFTLLGDKRSADDNLAYRDDEKQTRKDFDDILSIDETNSEEFLSSSSYSQSVFDSLDELGECNTSSDEDFFLIDIDDEDGKKDYDKKMTMEIFLSKKKKDSYKTKHIFLEEHLTQTIINQINNYDQFEDFRLILNSISPNIKDRLFNLLPGYVRDLNKRLNNWKKIDVNFNMDDSNNNSSLKKSRKILRLKIK